MINLFDSANYPTAEPVDLVAGSLWAWTRPDITLAYPTALYTLKYVIVQQSPPRTTINITALKTGAQHIVEVSAATTEHDVHHHEGDYAWQAIIVRDSDDEELVVDSGIVTITCFDGVSHVYATLVAIQATIKGAASQDQLVREIGGRRLESRSYGELMQLEKEYLKRWAAEKAAAERKRGRRGPRVLVGMSA
jgi:hypothetical protein